MGANSNSCAWCLKERAEPASTKLYVNGSLEQTLGAITLGTDTLANTVIGGTGEGPGGDNDPFRGLLDDLRINDRALSEAEIQLDMVTPGAGAITGVSSSALPPVVLRVFPNPFRSSTRIEPAEGGEIAIYDVTGRQVRKWRLQANAATRGLLPVNWDGADHRGRRLPAGIYFVTTGKQVARVALLR